MLKLSSTILSILISNWGCLGIFPPLVLVSFLLETCFMLSQPREPFFSPLILFPLRHATKCGATMHGIPVIGQQKLRPATETQSQLICTMKWPKYDQLTWLVIGSVLIWHMYNPLSFRWTTSMVRVQELCPLWLTLILGLFVTIWVWIARIAFESDLSHATWNRIDVKSFKKSIIMVNDLPYGHPSV